MENGSDKQEVNMSGNETSGGDVHIPPQPKATAVRWVNKKAKLAVLTESCVLVTRRIHVFLL